MWQPLSSFHNDSKCALPILFLLTIKTATGDLIMRKRQAAHWRGQEDAIKSVRSVVFFGRSKNTHIKGVYPNTCLFLFRCGCVVFCFWKQKRIHIHSSVVLWTCQEDIRIKEIIFFPTSIPGSTHIIHHWQYLYWYYGLILWTCCLMSQDRGARAGVCAGITGVCFEDTHNQSITKTRDKYKQIILIFPKFESLM